MLGNVSNAYEIHENEIDVINHSPYYPVDQIIKPGKGVSKIELNLSPKGYQNKFQSKAQKF